ncbi:glutaredoxin 3 [Agaricicola taiwanensis]|uniref:Glutaredoxin n=1 Tax=Agaricicola taiwanensis TaxID=591372 RepID=A0A8J2YMB4_9RHOB|nr:glutaredoxin 3 [Agaricicola taiwanensis]GGE52801.1 glutaredoxin 3 [Agaricicola taiwanensis]
MITIYTKPFCPYCARAKQLLTAKGAAFNEIDITQAPGARQEMLERAPGRSTVPQIFIGDTHVGGCDDLFDLDGSGALDPLLAKEGLS